MDDRLYNEIVEYCKKRLISKRALDIYEHLDLAHDVICNDSFLEVNYKIIVDRLIFSRLSEFRIKKIDVDKIHFKKNVSVEDIWRCANCNLELPKSKFQLSWKLCNKCYREENKERLREVNLKSYYKHHEKRLAEKRAYDKKYRQENLEEVRRKERERYHRNKKQKPLNK